MSKSLINPLSPQFKRLAGVAQIVLSRALGDMRHIATATTAEAGSSTVLIKNSLHSQNPSDVKDLVFSGLRHYAKGDADKVKSKLIKQIVEAFNRLEKRQEELDRAQKEAEKLYDQYEKQLLAHPLLTQQNKFFTDVLDKISREGISSDEAKIILENFKARTFNTIRSVLAAFTKALENGDFGAVAKAGKNFFEEAGSGDEKKVHLKLLEECFDAYVAKMFGPEFEIAPISEVRNSASITQGTKNFAVVQEKMFASETPYVEMMGFFTAHEFFAEKMLQQIFEKMFEPFKDQFEKDEYDKMVLYFKEHLAEGKDGGPSVEADHYIQARKAAIEAIAADLKNAHRFFEGAMANLDMQHKMFEFIAKAASLARDESKLVLPDAVVKKMVEKAASLAKTGTSKSPQDPEAEPLQAKSQQQGGAKQ